MVIDELKLDALTEILNIGSGRAACALSEITGSHIGLQVPYVHVWNPGENRQLAQPLNPDCGPAIRQTFRGGLAGQAFLAFRNKNALELARIVGEIPATAEEIDEELSGILEEIGNIVLNAVIGTIANILDCNLSYTVPQLCSQTTLAEIVARNSDAQQASDSIVLILETSFTVSDRKISSSLLLLFESEDIGRLFTALTDAAFA